MTLENKWPKNILPLSGDEEAISDDFVKFWHENLASKKSYKLIEKFNHGYPIKQAPIDFLTTLEIGAGLGEHLEYERLLPQQKSNYVACEIRENMGAEIKRRFSEVSTLVADCQKTLPYADGYFDRVIAIHVLEHLPNLPAALKEIYRVSNKQKGILSVVIPCEGGLLYTLSRKVSAQRLFEKRYQRSYRSFIEREHINMPLEIIEELEKLFTVVHKSYFPFMLPLINMNLCIGLTLRPKC